MQGKEEVVVQFSKAAEQQVLLTHEQPCCQAYSVNRGTFNDARVCFHRGVDADLNQAKALVKRETGKENGNAIVPP